MRVMHIITGLNTGGAEMALYKLLSRMDRAQYEPVVVSLMGEGTLGARIRELGVPVHTLGMRAGLPGPAAVWRLRRLVCDIQPDIIQGWMYHGNLAAWLARKLTRSKMPIVWGIHHSDSSTDKPLTRVIVRLGGLLSRKVNTTIYVANAAVPLHQSLGYKGAHVVIPNGFDLEQFQPSEEARQSVRAELGLPAATPLIGILGRYNAMKDHANLLHAAKIVLDKRPDVHFIMAGRDVAASNSALNQIVDSLGIRQNVHLLGERDDASRLMASMNVYASSSCGEAFPLVLGEAMACGVPCVATDVGDSAYIVGEHGRVVPPRDAEALADGISELLALPAAERMELQDRCRQRIMENFSISAIAAQYVQLYEKLA